MAAVEPPPQAAEPYVPPAPMPAAPFAAPVSFHSVSEHDAAMEAADHRPVRRRKAHEPVIEAPTPLQLVETSVAVPPPAEPEDELPRRTKPRRRRASPVSESGPLTLIETEATAEPKQDQPSTPPQ